MSGPLDGIRVIEMANVISGPYVGMLLADLGAGVVKVELPGGGDMFRIWDGAPGRLRPQFAAYNRGKRSVSLDARKPGGQAAYRRLAATADVIVEIFRPGTLDRLGIGYERIAEINPRVVYCAITGMGDRGPYRDRPTFDAIAQAVSGLWSQFTDMSEPEPLGPPLCDQLTALYAVQGVLAALFDRARSGRGQRIDVSMLGSAMAFQTNPIADYTMEGRVPDKLSRARRSQSYAFVAADGLPLAIHLSTPQKFWEGLARSLGRPELVDEPRFRDKAGRIRNYHELRRELAETFRTRPRAEWLAVLDRNDVPAAPINNVAESLQDPQVQALGLLRPFGEGQRRQELAGFPWDLSGTPCEPGLPPPDVGEHTVEVLRAAGYADEEIADLRREGAI